MATFNNIALLKEMEFPDAENTVIAYYNHTTDTTLNLVFSWQENSELIDNGGTVISRATGGVGRHILIKVRHDGQNEVPVENIGHYNLLWFGGSSTLYSTERVTNQNFLRNAYNAAIVNHPTISGYKSLEVFIPVGTYLCDDNPATFILPAHQGLKIRGVVNETTDGQGRPIVNTATSSILKKSVTGKSYNLLRLAKETGETLQDITVERLAFDGNRENLLSGAGGHNILCWSFAGSDDNGPVSNILFDTVWTYNCISGGLQNSFDGVSHKNCVIHHTVTHGFGTVRAVNILGSGLRAYMVGTTVDGDWGNSGYGVDYSDRTDRAVLEDFDIRDCSRSFKSSRRARRMILRNGVIENSGQLPNPSSTANGITHTAETITQVVWEIDNVLIKNSRNIGIRFAPGTDDLSGGKLYLGKIILDGNNAYNFYVNRRAEQINIDHVISRNFNGSGEESIRLHSGGSLLDKMVIRSGHFYDNQKTSITITTGTAVIANTRAASSNHFSGAGTIKFARLTDINGNPITSPGGSGTRVQLPICGITDIQIDGNNLVLTSTITAGTGSLSGASVKFIYAKKGVFPHLKLDENWDVVNNHKEFPGTASLVSGSTYSLTVVDYATILESGVEYWIFAEITLTNGDKSIEHRNYETGEYIEADFGEADTPGKVGNASRLPENESDDVSSNPEYVITNVDGGVTHYEIRIGLDVSSGDVIDIVRQESNIQKHSGDTTSFTLGGSLELGKLHYWQVRAVNPAADPAEGDWSDTWSFTTMEEPTVAPGKPLLTSPTNGETGVSLTVIAKWTRGDNSTHHGIVVSENPDLSLPVISEANIGDVVEYQLSGLSKNKVYYWQVTAYNAEGSIASVIWSFTTGSEVQILKPSSTIDAGSWTVTGAATMHGALVELSDGSYIFNDTPGGDPAIIGLAVEVPPAITPDIKTGWKLGRVRVRHIGDNKIRIVINENDGDTIDEDRATFEITTVYESFTQIDLEISESDAGDIVDVNDLRLKFYYEVIT
jgi:hypothetical protein